ncbi:MAG: hypothetical protein QG555_1087 [Thermodesulfobacteriota bacterium]|jgi:hypothetical protein|nr:hypothetical protein [Thermodesulfobacteriota bacterium]
MNQATWGFIAVSVIFWAVFFLRPPWTVENVLLGGVPLVFGLFFGYRFWRASKDNPQVLPDDYEDD